MGAAIEEPARSGTTGEFAGHRIDSLDGLRGAAVGVVVAFHVFRGGFGGGRLGVDVFFVLSGFLITTIICREYERSEGFRFARFYSRRLFRLYPALLATVIASAPFLGYLTESGSFTAWSTSAVTAATYTMNLAINADAVPSSAALSPTWSLALEEQFYLAWPILLVLLLKTRGGLQSALLGALVCVAVSWTCLLVVFRSPEFHPDARAGALMLGCASALGVAHRSIGKPVATVTLWLSLPGLVAALTAASLGSKGFRPGFVPVVSVIAALLVPSLLADPRHPSSRLLALAWVSWLGRRSYSVYLLHVPVLAVLEGLTGWRAAQAAVVGIPLILLLSDVLYRWVEQPFLRLRDRRSNVRLSTTAES